MTVSDQATSPKQFTGRHMLFIMIAFFGVIIAVNITMATLASKSWTGLVVKNSYVASQHFNDELQAAKVQNDLGWKSSVSYSGGALIFKLSDTEGKQLVLENAVLGIGRPAVEAEDRVIELTHVGAGEYRAELGLADGVWDARITAATGGQSWRRDVRLMVKDGGAAVK